MASLYFKQAGASLRHPGDIDYEMARDMTIEYLASTNHYYLILPLYLDVFFLGCASYWRGSSPSSPCLHGHHGIVTPSTPTNLGWIGNNHGFTTSAFQGIKKMACIIMRSPTVPLSTSG